MATGLVTRIFVKQVGGTGLSASWAGGTDGREVYMFYELVQSYPVR